jgi:hypothetical protein
VDEFERRQMIQRLREDSERDQADMERRRSAPEYEPMERPLVRKSSEAGMLTYRTQENALVGPAADEDAASEWRSWFADNLICEFRDGPSGEIILKVINQLIADKVDPLERRIRELENQAERRNVIDELMAAATVALRQFGARRK